MKASEPDATEIQFSDDLPKELKAELPKPRKAGAYEEVDECIVKLLGDHGDLHKANLMIGVYRRLNRSLDKKQMYNRLRTLKMANLIETAADGRTALTVEGQRHYDEELGGES